MRFAVISDVHGNVIALQRVLSHARAFAVDGFINLGDCVSAPLWPRETFDVLQDLAALTVRGNHDRWLADQNRIAASATVSFTHGQLSLEARGFLSTLPATLRIREDILAVHGTSSSDMDYLLEDSINDRLCLVTTTTLDARLANTREQLILCGHSHQQNAAWASAGRLVVNPGAVGAPRYAGNGAPLLNEAGSPHARYAIVTRTERRWSVEFFVLEYDFSIVERRARSLGRNDWADGFMKGM
jgi:putative phosphoesterase